MTTVKQMVADHEEYLDGQGEVAAERAASTGLTRETAHVIWSRKRSAYWLPSGSGYTTELSQAGVYSEHDALEIERQSAHGPEHTRSVAVALATLPIVNQFNARPGTVLWLLTKGEA